MWPPWTCLCLSALSSSSPHLSSTALCTTLSATGSRAPKRTRRRKTRWASFQNELNSDVNRSFILDSVARSFLIYVITFMCYNGVSFILVKVQRPHPPLHYTTEISHREKLYTAKYPEGSIFSTATTSNYSMSGACGSNVFSNPPHICYICNLDPCHMTEESASCEP